MPPRGGRGEAAPGAQGPPWRPRLHHDDATLGIAGVREAHVDTLSAHALRDGAPVVAPVAHEWASAAPVVHERLDAGDGRVNELLDTLVDAVREARRARGAQAVAAHAPRTVPPRAALSEARLAAYLRDLADTAVPLERLSKTVPQGLRSERLLDALWTGGASPTALAASDALPRTASVPVSRAVWLIRTIGAVDADRLRGVSLPLGHMAHSTDPTADITTAIVQWLSAHLRVPPPPTSRSRWAAKWTYGAALAHALLSEGLVDRFAYLRFVAAQLAAAPVPLAGCVLQLAEAYLAEMLAHKALGAALVAALSVRVRDGGWLAAQAQRLGARCARSGALSEVLPVLVPMLLPPQQEHAVDVWDGASVALLDESVGMASLFPAYFLPRHATAALARRRLSLLLTWATTRERRGVHRAHVAVALMHVLDECQAQRLVLPDGRRLPCPWEPISLFDAIMQWVDDVDAATTGRTTSGTLPADVLSTVAFADMARLLGLLAHAELFRFARFLQRLVERGVVRMIGDVRTQRHSPSLAARLLRSMPLPPDVSQPLRIQRRFAIYGVRASESYEETMERRALRELRFEFPWMATTDAPPHTPELRRKSSVPWDLHAVPPSSAPSPTFHARDTLALQELWRRRDNAAPPLSSPGDSPLSPTYSTSGPLSARLPHTYAASPYTQARIVEQLIAPLLADVAVLDVDGFVCVATLLTDLHAMDALGRLLCALLDSHGSQVCLVSICHAVAAHARVWDALDLSAALAKRVAPYAMHESSMPGAPRVVHAGGLSVVVGVARAALTALAEVDAPVPKFPALPDAAYVEGSRDFAGLVMPAAAPPRSTQQLLHDVLEAPRDALDAACTALISVMPLQDAAAALYLYALHRHAAAAHAPPPHVIAAIATLAGIAGVRFDQLTHSWIRGVTAAARAPLSTAWTTVVLGMVRHAFVHGASLLTHVLAPWVAHTADGSHPLWPSVVALARALIAAPCDADVSPCAELGLATCHDVGLVRDALIAAHGLLPWLAALAACGAPQRAELLAALGPLWPELRHTWHARPAACWRGIKEAAALGDDAAAAHALRWSEVLAAETCPEHLFHAGAGGVALPTGLAAAAEHPRDTQSGPREAALSGALPTSTPLDTWHGGLALLELRMRLHEGADVLRPPHLYVLFPAPAACGAAPGELLRAYDLPASTVQWLVTTALQDLATAHARAHAPGQQRAVHALVRLVHAWITPPPCDALAAAEAAAVLPAVLDSALALPERLAAVLSVLSCTTAAARATWSTVLDRLEALAAAEPLAAAVSAEVQRSLPADVVDAWMQRTQRLPVAAPYMIASNARAALHGIGAALPTTAWTCVDDVSTTAGASADPWDDELANRGALSLSLFGAVKTREHIRSAAPPWLASERTYGDGDSAWLLAPASLAKRRRHEPLGVSKRRRR